MLGLAVHKTQAPNPPMRGSLNALAFRWGVFLSEHYSTFRPPTKFPQVEIWLPREGRGAKECVARIFLILKAGV